MNDVVKSFCGLFRLLLGFPVWTSVAGNPKKHAERPTQRQTHHLKRVQSCIFELSPTCYQRLYTCLTLNETLIYNSSVRGDDMKAHVLKTQLLICVFFFFPFLLNSFFFFNIKNYTRFIKVENTHWNENDMLHLLENMVAVPEVRRSVKENCSPRWTN